MVVHGSDFEAVLEEDFGFYCLQGASHLVSKKKCACQVQGYQYVQVLVSELLLK